MNNLNRLAMIYMHANRAGGLKGAEALGHLILLGTKIPCIARLESFKAKRSIMWVYTTFGSVWAVV